MNLESMIDKQAELDQSIIEGKNLNVEDHTLDKFLALQVELAECANDWRGFKFWKVDKEPKETLLEEYVDCVHFFLSIAIEKGWENLLSFHEEAIHDLEDEGLSGGVTGAILEVKYFLSKAALEASKSEIIEKKLGMTKQEYEFRSAWFVFIGIGLIGFKFTLEQIEKAYFNKNDVNHERQETGY